jgi:hypothetical protein
MQPVLSHPIGGNVAKIPHFNISIFSGNAHSLYFVLYYNNEKRAINPGLSMRRPHLTIKDS